MGFGNRTEISQKFNGHQSRLSKKACSRETSGCLLVLVQAAAGTIKSNMTGPEQRRNEELSARGSSTWITTLPLKKMGSYSTSNFGGVHLNSGEIVPDNSPLPFHTGAEMQLKIYTLWGDPS